MFAYCRNNPVNRYDIRGYSDSKFEEKNDDEVETAPDPNDGGGGLGGDGSNSGGRVGSVNGGNGGNQNNSGKGFKSFRALKNYLGSAGSGNHWHHIVEQCQKLKSGFTSEQINNTSNVVAVDAKTHAQITGYYNRKDFEFTNGLSVRNWLAGQPYEVQYDFGLSVLQGFGVIP